MSSDQKVSFTVEQVELLEKLFPEMLYSAEATLGELMQAQGQRTVLAKIRQLARVEVRYVRRAVPS